MLQTEFPFTLPKGLVDTEGNLHREGTMRLATAYDEIAPLKDPRVQQNPGYLTVILLSRVIVRLGSLEPITPKTIEGLFAADLAYLQEFYSRINGSGQAALQVTCPYCQEEFQVETNSPGVVGYPLEQLYEEVAFIALHFHWSYDTLMALEHPERRRWVDEIRRLAGSQVGPGRPFSEMTRD